QVLNGFLAQIVIDPVDATFREILRDGLVDDARRGQVVADGLLQHHARLLGQPRRGNVFADRPVYRRWRGEVGDQLNIGRYILGKRGIILAAAKIQGEIVQALAKVIEQQR